MRSRYSAYALGLADYIIRTTHPDNSDFRDETEVWREEILYFTAHTAFLGLNITSFEAGENEAFVTFEANLSSGMLKERSRFLKENGRWLYRDGTWEQEETTPPDSAQSLL